MPHTGSRGRDHQDGGHDDEPTAADDEIRQPYGPAVGNVGPHDCQLLNSLSRFKQNNHSVIGQKIPAKSRCASA